MELRNNYTIGDSDFTIYTDYDAFDPLCQGLKLRIRSTGEIAVFIEQINLSLENYEITKDCSLSYNCEIYNILYNGRRIERYYDNKIINNFVLQFNEAINENYDLLNLLLNL